MKKQRYSWLTYCLVGIMAIGLISVFIGCPGEDTTKPDTTGTEYTVTIDPGIVNGTVTADPMKGKQGTRIRVTATPDDTYKLSTLQYNGRNVPSSGIFTMPRADVTITATFTKDLGSLDDGIPPFDYEAWLAQIEVWRSELQPIVEAMTIDEKAGQMTQSEYNQTQPRIGNSGEVINGNDVSAYFLGSVLSGGHTGPMSDGSGSQGTPAQWVQYTNLLVTDSYKTRLRIPVIYGRDDMHGASKAKNSTMLPHEVGLGAIGVGGGLAEGRRAAYQGGLVTAKEMLASGSRWTFGPVLGVPYNIRAGRAYEMYSEDVEIVRGMATAVIRGYIDGGAAPSSKHFGPEGQTDDATTAGSATITLDDYRPIAMPYKAAIEAGSMCIMSFYGSRNGTRSHEDREVLTTLLKDEWGFKGMIISDWSSLTSVSGATYADKVANGINAGIDMIMAANNRQEWLNTIEGIKAIAGDGRVSMDRINDAVMRILLFKKSIGVGKPEYVFWQKYGHDGNDVTSATDEEISPLMIPGETRTEENKAVAADLVAKSLVLLKNEGNAIQNLKNASSILLIGQGGDDVGLACGGWTVAWQGGAGNITAGVTLRQALLNIGMDVTFSATGAGATASNADAVIAVISEATYAEGQGDRTGNVTERTQDAQVLANAITAAGDKPLILIIYSGRPLHMTDRLDGPKPEAVVAAWLPGSEAGTGIVDVLFTDREFVGKTAYTWFRTAAENNAATAMVDGKKPTPPYSPETPGILYPYGFGLRKSGN